MNFFKKTILVSGVVAMILGGVSFFVSAGDVAAADCKVNTIVLNPHTLGDTFEPAGFSEKGNQQLKISIATENCAKKKVEVSLHQQKPATGRDTAPDVLGLHKKDFIVPDTEFFEITMKMGDRECELISSSPECTYYVTAQPDGGVEATIVDSRNQAHGKGKLSYDCSGDCQTFWTFISDTSVKNEEPNLIYVTNSETSNVDVNSACFDKSMGTMIAGCYEFYGGFTQALEGKFKRFDNMSNFGDLLNGIIAFGIGIGGVLAVGMIMYQGFLYMKTDNANTISDIKSRITQTVLGFLLLLSIYVLLRTINPDLLNLVPRFGAVTITAPEGQDLDAAFETALEKNPDLSKIYAPTKGHMRDGGSLRPTTPEARMAMADSIAQNTLTDLTTKNITVKSGTGKFLETGVATKLAKLDATLKQGGINIVVTEAFKPSIYRHFAACHYTATCVDADFTTGFNAQRVAFFISEASKNGLIAMWETKDKNHYKQLLDAKVSPSNIILFKGNHITGDHFSVYEYK